MDGAVGVIIYDSRPFREDDQSGSMVTKIYITMIFYSSNYIENK